MKTPLKSRAFHKYFVKVQIATYSDKNKLQSSLKAKIKEFDNTLLKWNLLDAFKDQIRSSWAEIHQQNMRCKPIGLDERSSVYMYEDPNQEHSYSIGSYSIGRIYIYPVMINLADA